MSFRGAIFDLDGVVVNTVPLHFKAWQKMFAEFGKHFTFSDYKAKVDGIPRLDGAQAILPELSPEELDKAATKKQTYFLEELEKEGIEVYPTTLNLIRQLRAEGIKIAIISSSRNCPRILKRAGLYPLIDVEINGGDITRGKPDPGIFLMAKEKLGLEISECIVFEDAVLGVAAAKRGGFKTVGVDRHQDPERLQKADLVVKDLEEVDYNKLNALLS